MTKLTKVHYIFKKSLEQFLMSKLTVLTTVQNLKMNLNKLLLDVIIFLTKANVNNRASSKGLMKNENYFNIETMGFYLNKLGNTPSTEIKILPHSTKNSKNFTKLKESQQITSPLKNSSSTFKINQMFNFLNENSNNHNFIHEKKQNESRFHIDNNYVLNKIDIDNTRKKSLHSNFKNNSNQENSHIFVKNKILRSIQSIM